MEETNTYICKYRNNCFINFWPLFWNFCFMVASCPFLFLFVYVPFPSVFSCFVSFVFFITLNKKDERYYYWTKNQIKQPKCRGMGTRMTSKSWYECICDDPVVEGHEKRACVVELPRLYSNNCQNALCSTDCDADVHLEKPKHHQQILIQAFSC